MYQKQQNFLDIYKELQDYEKTLNLNSLTRPVFFDHRIKPFQNPNNHPTLNIQYLRKKLDYEPIQSKNVTTDKSIATLNLVQSSPKPNGIYNPTVYLENPFLRPVII